MRQSTTIKTLFTPVQRIRIWYAFLVLIFCIFVVRLFYLQVIRQDYYQQAALVKQLKEYEIPATRGVIVAQNGEDTVPIVLNETKYTLFADPVYVQDPSQAASAIASIIGGNAADYEQQLRTEDTRYVVLAKKLDKDTKDKLDALEFKGVGTREAIYRTYPQDELAAQVLGFVNDNGEGVYGVEQALDERLRGAPGRLRAITDAQGVPLAGNRDNVVIEPQAGEDVVLTIDIGMQRQLEEVLKQGLKRAKSDSGSALILEADTGAVKAMANYPTYNPADFYNVENIAVFNNGNVSSPLEVGSIMKPLTAAAAIDQGVVNRNSSYFDPGFYEIDGAKVTNVEIFSGAGTKTMVDILQQSLNTGATWLLMQMGGGEINQQARTNWHTYMTDHYRFGQLTGIEQGYESPGTVPSPNEGYGLSIRYANTAFGQGMTATPLQMGSALAAVINGGDYYQPHLVSKVVNADDQEEVTEPKVLDNNVVSDRTSQDLRYLMEEAFRANHLNYGMDTLPTEFSIGGKTGTAQLTKPDGGYYEDRYNGTFLGYIGGDTPQYVVVVRVDTPKIPGFAGSQAAAPVFTDIAEMLINNSRVTPRS